MRFAIGNPAALLNALAQNGLNTAADTINTAAGVIPGMWVPPFLRGPKGAGRNRDKFNEFWLNRTYNKHLGRDVGQEGLDYWGNELSEGASYRDVYENIMRSDEAWLNKTYNDLLGRNVGDAGRTYWGDELAGGASRESVKDNIMLSDEYRDYQDSLENPSIPEWPFHGHPSFSEGQGQSTNENVAKFGSSILRNLGGIIGGIGGGSSNATSIPGTISKAAKSIWY